MRLSAMVILLLALAPVAVRAQPAVSVDRIDITERGIFRTHLGKLEKNGEVTTGSLRIVGPGKLVKSTTTIPGRLHARFGFKFKVSGSPAGAVVTLDCVTRFPPQGITHPKTGQVHHEDRFKATVPVGKVGYAGYFVGRPWEIVPGTWTFELWYEGRKLAEQQFTMLAP